MTRMPMTIVAVGCWWIPTGAQGTYRSTSFNASYHGKVNGGKANFDGLAVTNARWADPARQALVLLLGLFVQDQWTLRRLTLNLGLRFDYFTGYMLAQSAPASAFLPERSIPRIDDIPNWKDLYNAFNRAPVLGVNTQVGSRWLVPTQILEGRLVQLSGRFTF